MYSYSLVVGRKSHTLPARNLRLAEEMERAAGIDSVRNMPLRNKYEGVLGFIVNTLGEDSAKEIFGSLSVEEVDLSMITVVFRMIVDAYNKPISDYNTKRSNEIFSSIPSDKIGEVVKLAEVARDLPDD